MFPRNIIEDNLPEITDAQVAHYTRIGTLCHFLPHENAGWSSAWATPVQFLNDRMELALGLKTLYEAANGSLKSESKIISIVAELQTGWGQLETDAFQMSFSGNPDELGQWRGYASNGMGCSVVTDVKSLHEVADVAGWVLYDENEQKEFARKVLSNLLEVTDNGLIEQVLIAAACFMKHKGFQSEKEFRLIHFPDLTRVKFRESGERLVPYFDFLAESKNRLPISSIIIGPGWQLPDISSDKWKKNTVVLGIRRLLNARGLHAVDIVPSAIPYDPK